MKLLWLLLVISTNLFAQQSNEEMLGEVLARARMLTTIRNVEVVFGVPCIDRAQTNFNPVTGIIDVRLCPDAFRDKKLLVSTLVHEQVHVQQYQKMRIELLTVDGFVSKGTLSVNQQITAELEAYYFELEFARLIKLDEPYLSWIEKAIFDFERLRFRQRPTL